MLHVDIGRPRPSCLTTPTRDTNSFCSAQRSATPTATLFCLESFAISLVERTTPSALAFSSVRSTARRTLAVLSEVFLPRVWFLTEVFAKVIYLAMINFLFTIGWLCINYREFLFIMQYFLM